MTSLREKLNLVAGDPTPQEQLTAVSDFMADMAEDLPNILQQVLHRPPETEKDWKLDLFHLARHQNNPHLEEAVALLSKCTRKQIRSLPGYKLLHMSCAEPDTDMKVEIAERHGRHIVITMNEGYDQSPDRELMTPGGKVGFGGNLSAPAQLKGYTAEPTVGFTAPLSALGRKYKP